MLDNQRFQQEAFTGQPEAAAAKTTATASGSASSTTKFALSLAALTTTLLDYNTTNGMKICKKENL